MTESTGRPDSGANDAHESAPDPAETMLLLQDVMEGNRDATDELLSRVYQDLHRIASSKMRDEPQGGLLQPTALVHESYLRLIDQNRITWQGRAHFLAIAARMMRRILVDHARSQGRVKRGGRRKRIDLDAAELLSTQSSDDVLDLEEALETLAELDARQAQIVELRFFGGMTVDEVAELLGFSKRTIESDWTMARAWLRRELGPEDGLSEDNVS